VSIEDEARTEAEKRWPENEWASGASGLGPEQMKSARRTGFVAGAEWQASRKVDAAPSDTDRETLEQLMYPWLELDGRASAAHAILAAGFSRSQPVEVTDEMVRAVSTNLFTFDSDYKQAKVRAALEAALGGGE